MNFLKEGKTNWKYIIIVLILALIVGGGILGWIKMQEVPFGEWPEIKKPEKVVEEKPEKAEEETTEWKTYQSPDNLLYAQIIPAKQNLIGNAYESRVEIRTKENRLLQTADYTSEDGDHGLIVARVEWTPDSQFFIYSTYSSGGHQPWFSRVYFYSRANNKIYDFSEVSGFTVANNEFTVAAPDIVTFTVYTSPGIVGPTTTKSFKLSEIISALDWETYRNEEYGFEIQYPGDIITLSPKTNGIVLIHSISLEHPNPCDFKGDASPLKELTDFKVTLEVINKNLRETIIANESEYLVSNFLLDNKLKITPGFIEEFSVSLLEGYRIMSGVEGCGRDTYYFPLNSENTLFITRSWVAEFNPINLDYKKYLQLPGIIPPEKGSEIFKQIVSTFRFLK